MINSGTLIQELGSVAHACDPSYLRSGEQGISVEASLGKTLGETLPQPASWAWWFLPVTPAMQEV
jgi:hypothetical protein